MTTVLVTGGAGYVGSHVVLALLDAGRQVAVIDDLSTGSRAAVPSGVAFYAGSVADGRVFDQIAAAHDVRAILHFAGSVVAPASVAAPLDYYRNNTAASRGLIEHAVRHGVRHFVFSSSAAVYGRPGAQPVNEDRPCRPANPYGWSKLMTEIMLADVAAAHPFNYAALRYFNVAGADPAGRAGQLGTAATHLIKVAVEAACGKRAEVRIHGADYATPDGTGVRDYIHVSDLAAAHVAALDRLISRPDDSLTLNCGYGRGASVLEVLDAVDAVAGVSLRRAFGPRRPGDADMLVADPVRLRATLGWRPRFDDLAVIVAHALAWERRGLCPPATLPRSA
jgi:UDP-glucose 4-epimerase